MCIKTDAAIPVFLYPPPASNVDRIRTVGQGRVGTGQHLFCSLLDWKAAPGYVCLDGLPRGWYENTNQISCSGRMP
jgi:hypothetical protein